MKKIIFSALFLLFYFNYVNAESFTEGSWRYTVISNVNLTVKLVGRSGTDSYYWQNVTEIPSTVIHNGITFTVTKIGKKATHWCGYYREDFCYGNNITSLIIPNTITYIEDSAFWECTNLSNITFYSTNPPSMGTDVFRGVPLYAFVYVPCGRISTYSNHSYLNRFTHFVETGSYGTIFAQANNPEQGTVTITQEPTCTTPAIVEASNIVHHNVNGTQYATSYYHFTSWNDGDTSNPRTVYVTSDTSITALFEPNMYYCTGISNDTNQGIVIGDTVGWMDTAYITAIPKYGYKFSFWQVWSTPGSCLNNYSNPYPRVYGSSSIYQLKAFFINDTFNVVGNSDGGGYVIVGLTNSSSGNFPYLSNINILARPLEGNRFVMWDDGNTFQNRRFTLTSDTTFFAVFAPIASLRDTIYDTLYVHDTITIHDTVYIHDTVFVDPTGIDGMETVNAKIYQRDGRIVVESGDGGPLGEVRVFDVMGRMLTHSSALKGTSPNLGEELDWRATFEVPASGTYIVKIGDRTARKIVVIR